MDMHAQTDHRTLNSLNGGEPRCGRKRKEEGRGEMTDDIHRGQLPEPYATRQGRLPIASAGFRPLLISTVKNTLPITMGLGGRLTP